MSSEVKLLLYWKIIVLSLILHRARSPSISVHIISLPAALLEN